MKRRPAGIPPRAPYIMVRMTEPQARTMLDLCKSVCRDDELAPPGYIQNVDRVTTRIRKAKVRYPKRRSQA